MRHGFCEDNAKLILNGRRDSFLTELGRRQAMESAQKLKEENIKMIYSSPLKRAYETAIIVAQVLDPVDLDIDLRLIERHFGVLTGKSVKDIPLHAREIIKGDRVDYFLDTQDAESYDVVYERAEAVLGRVLDSHISENILLVTHGAVGQIIRAAYYGWSWKEALQKMPYFDNTDIIKLNGVKPKL